MKGQFFVTYGQAIKIVIKRKNIMKYDLIVAGAGPCGLMAAKTAAADGLKVLLVERRKKIEKISRACTQIFYLRKLTPVGSAETGQRRKDGYLEPVSVEVTSENSRFNFYGPGFQVDFSGCLRPYMNWIQVSPSGYCIYRYKLNDGIWGFYFQKEVLMADLLEAAMKAGAEVVTGAAVIGAENKPEGVSVTIAAPSGYKSFEAGAMIAADGKRSKVVESIGLNKDRRQFAPSGRKFVHYIMEGVETDLPGSSFVSLTIPGINPFGNIMLSMGANNTSVVGTMAAGGICPASVIDKFIYDSQYSRWFQRTRIIKKEAAVGRSGGALTPVEVPVEGNVIVAGDAGAPSETWVQGALASGFQAVKAFERQMDGQDGYLEYIKWWQKSFAFNTPEYLKLNQGLYPVNRICTDEDVDYIFNRFKDRTGIPQLIVANNMDIIRKEKPVLYKKFAAAVKK